MILIVRGEKDSKFHGREKKTQRRTFGFCKVAIVQEEYENLVPKTERERRGKEGLKSLSFCVYLICETIVCLPLSIFV